MSESPDRLPSGSWRHREPDAGVAMPEKMFKNLSGPVVVAAHSPPHERSQMNQRVSRRLALTAIAAGASAPLLSLPLKAHAAEIPTDCDQSVTLRVDGQRSFVAPVDVPAPDAGRPVFAHYLPTLPLSLDNAAPENDYYNQHYLRPTGEGGKFYAIGGFLRDRPLPRNPISGDWQLADLRTEVGDAVNAGLSGFAAVLLETSGTNWARVVRLFEAAAAEDARFKIMLQPDMTAQPGSLSPQALAGKLSELARLQSVYRSGSGRAVVSPFAAEVKEPWYWQQFNDAMAAYGTPVDLLPLFVDLQNGANIDRYAGVSYAMGEWGSRTPDVLDRAPDYAARAHGMGKQWMSPVAAQDVRPGAGTFMEPKNMGGLRSSWNRAIRTNSDIVMMVSWNDYSESTQFAPSVDHGYSLLSLSSYYLAWFRRGSQPSITRDAAYASFRVQPVAAQTTVQQRLMGVSWLENAAPVDLVEVQTIVRGPTEIALQLGSRWLYYQAPAGVSTRTFPLAEGQVRLVAIRDGSVVTAMLSGQSVVSGVAVQDLAYHMIGGPRA